MHCREKIWLCLVLESVTIIVGIHDDDIRHTVVCGGWIVRLEKERRTFSTLPSLCGLMCYRKGLRRIRGTTWKYNGICIQNKAPTCIYLYFVLFVIICLKCASLFSFFFRFVFKIFILHARLIFVFFSTFSFIFYNFFFFLLNLLQFIHAFFVFYRLVVIFWILISHCVDTFRVVPDLKIFEDWAATHSCHYFVLYMVDDEGNPFVKFKTTIIAYI